MGKKRAVSFGDFKDIRFSDAWAVQERLFNGIIEKKIAQRNIPQSDLGEEHWPDNYFLYCEHPPVYTLGKSGKENHLLINEEFMRKRGIDFHKINRGGDITFHGPGQVVGYPILDLDQFFTDIHRFMRSLEEVIILTLADFGISAGRLKEATGVWLEPGKPGKERKIAAMGIRCSRWVTMHGYALNVNTDLNYFNLIVPCGITGKAVTSMEKELGQKTDQEMVKQHLTKHFLEVFEAEKTSFPVNESTITTAG